MDPLVLSGRTGLGAPGVPAAPRSPGLTQPHLRLLPGGGHPAWAPRTGALASHPERGEGAPALGRPVGLCDGHFASLILALITSRGGAVPRTGARQQTRKGSLAICCFHGGYRSLAPLWTGK